MFLCISTSTHPDYSTKLQRRVIAIQRDKAQEEVDRLLAIQRSDPTQEKHSVERDPKWDEDGCWKMAENGVWTRDLKAGSPTTGGSEWAPVDMSKMDELYDAIPNASLDFKFYNLFSYGKFQKFNGTWGTWKEFMNDRGIGARKRVSDVVAYHCDSTVGPAIGSLPAAGCRPADGRCRLMDDLVVYAAPWKTYSWGDVINEYSDKVAPFTQYEG